MTKYTRSTLYLLPLLYNEKSFTVKKITNPKNGFSLDNLYLAEASREEFSNYDSNKEYIHCILKINNPNSDELKTFLFGIITHPLYCTHYSIDFDIMNIVFKVDKITSEFIIDKFKKGKYSELPDVYLRNFESLANQSLDSVFNIITKNPFLRSHLEKQLNVILPNDAELDSIPYVDQETYNYGKKKKKQASGLE